jgi:hypothetical protein
MATFLHTKLIPGITGNLGIGKHIANLAFVHQSIFSVSFTISTDGPKKRSSLQKFQTN